MSVMQPASVWRQLNAIPQVGNWRRNRINEVEGFEGDLRNLRDELRRGGSFLLWIKACERTRFYWSRFHAVGMTGSLPLKLARSGYEFLAIVKDILGFKEAVVAACPAWGPLCHAYGHSMELRCMLVTTLLNSTTVEVREVLWRELPDHADYRLEDDGMDLSGNVPTDKSSQNIIVCGSYWIIAHKLDSWRLELVNEAGPFAHSIRNHHELVFGGLQLFSLILKTAERLGDSEETKRAGEFRKQIEDEVVRPLALFWAEINDRKPIPGDDLLSAEDLSPDHPLEERARAIIDDMRRKVVPLADEAERRFKQARGLISRRDWDAWITLAFEDRYEFELPECTVRQDPAVWGRVLTEVLERLHEVNSRDHLLQLWEALRDSPEMEPDAAKRAASQVLLTGRLLELDFAGSLDLVRRRLLEDEPGTPHGFFELQMIGHVLRTVRQAANRTQSEKVLQELLRSMCEANPERWGRTTARNALLARLLAAYFVVVPEDHVDSIGRLWVLGQHCAKTVGGDPHFFQTLARDTLRLLGQGDGVWGKLIILCRLAPRAAVRWPEKLQQLSALWRMDGLAATAPPA